LTKTGTEPALRGHCLCGDVHYESTGPAGDMWYCHCRDCRKAGGVGFGTWIGVPGVRWSAGESRVVRTAPSPTGLTRAFCSQCGSVLPAQRARHGDALLPAGGLDGVGKLQPGRHDCTEARLPWLPAPEGLPRMSASEGSSPRPADTWASGSCLCGGVAWEVERPLVAMRACHCSRCRRRSGSSWFVGAMTREGALRLLRGAQAIRTWHMPGTRFYSVSFCEACGGPAPAVLPKGSFVSVGCLDDDPGARLLCHVFHGSRAPWVDVKDGLPRFEAFVPPDFDWISGGGTPAA
jgi:hypothetical protein